MVMQNRILSLIPMSTIQTIRDYIEHGLEPGDFVRACLENNLKMAFACADIHNERALKEIVQYLYNYVPFNAWGSEKAVADWLKMRESNRKAALTERVKQ